MSRLTDLIAQAKAGDPQMGAEAVELPQRPVRKGDKVRVLPERASTICSATRMVCIPPR